MNYLFETNNLLWFINVCDKLTWIYTLFSLYKLHAKGHEVQKFSHKLGTITILVHIFLSYEQSVLQNNIVTWNLSLKEFLCAHLYSYIVV